MTTEVRQQVLERDVGAGGEEVYEVEKGVRVRKSGGVESVPSLSAQELESRRADLAAQIEHQKLVISRAREEAANASRQANEQEILAREALEIKEFNRNRQIEAASEARTLMIEVSALIDKEKELERQRAAAHHAAVEKERERVQAKTAEIIAREEAIEAEKREHYYNELVRKCQALNLRYKLEEEQAKLKLESLQFNLQHGEFMAVGPAARAKIVVEVAPRELPEARQFDTSQVEVGIAAATMEQEGFPTIADTRSIEEIVLTERRARTSTSGGSFASQRGGIYESEKRDVELSGETPSAYGVPSSIIPPPTTPSSSGDNIKILPDIKPSAAEAGYVGGQSMGMGQVPQQQGFVGVQGQQFQQQPVVQQAGGVASTEVSGTGVAAEGAKKKKESGGFFKKFKSTKSHEQHQH